MGLFLLKGVQVAIVTLFTESEERRMSWLGREGDEFGFRCVELKIPAKNPGGNI